MTGPSSNPRGEHAPTRHGTELRTIETVVDDEDESAFGWTSTPPPLNRATRRAHTRATRRSR